MSKHIPILRETILALDEDYEAMKSWVGKDWDPEKFDNNSIQFDNLYNRWKKAFLKK